MNLEGIVRTNNRKELTVKDLTSLTTSSSAPSLAD